jgi:hypothetical protein
MSGSGSFSTVIDEIAGHDGDIYQLHLWQQDSGLVTHTAVLDEWPDPAPSSPGL